MVRMQSASMTSKSVNARRPRLETGRLRLVNIRLRGKVRVAVLLLPAGGNGDVVQRGQRLVLQVFHLELADHSFISDTLGIRVRNGLSRLERPREARFVQVRFKSPYDMGPMLHFLTRGD